MVSSVEVYNSRYDSSMHYDKHKHYFLEDKVNFLTKLWYKCVGLVEFLYLLSPTVIKKLKFYFCMKHNDRMRTAFSLEEMGNYNNKACCVDNLWIVKKVIVGFYRIN